MARVSLVVDQETFDSTNTTFEPVPVGEYLCTIYSIESTEVKSGQNAGKPRLNVQYRIADGETAPDGSKQGNRRLFDGINVFPGTNRKTGAPTQPFQLIALAKAMGTSADELADLDTDDWVGEEIRVKVGHQPKQHLVNGSYVDIEPVEYRETVKGVRSVESAAVAAKATAKVNKAGKPKYSL